MNEERRVHVTIEAVVVLGDADDYPDGLDLAGQVKADMDTDPAMFFMNQAETVEITAAAPAD